MATAARLVVELERGAADPDGWVPPWADSTRFLDQRNAVTSRRYRGGNVWRLAFETLDTGAVPWWATFRQWASVDARVRKGEHGTGITVYRTYRAEDDGGEEVERRYLGAATVFHAGQVDGWEVPRSGDALDDAARHAWADSWLRVLEAADGGPVVFRDQVGAAWFDPSRDVIHVPPFDRFREAGGYYGTLLHELTHWTGHERRLGRDLSGRFGDDGYALEELVAEVGAAMGCALLGVSVVPRQDHAHYLAHWARVGRADGSAIWQACSQASRAVDCLEAAAGVSMMREEVASNVG